MRFLLTLLCLCALPSSVYAQTCDQRHADERVLIQKIRDNKGRATLERVQAALTAHDALKAAGCLSDPPPLPPPPGPSLSCSTPVTSVSPDGNPVTVTYAAPVVSGGVAPLTGPICMPASGSLFPVGNALAVCAVSDVLQRSASCDVSVTVTYTPVISPISQSGWTLKSVDSQETTPSANNLATNAFDGNPETFWATEWVTVSPYPPHEIQIDLGAMYEVSGLRYLPRQDISNGRIAQYEFYVSTDGTTWGPAVASGTFPNVTAEQSATFDAKSGKYVRLRALSERKFWFAYLAKALVVFPGGFGTCDELFEILTLVQTDKLSKKIEVILYGRAYWEQILDFKPMAEWGAIAERDLELVHYADTPVEAFDRLQRHLIDNHLEPPTAQEAAAPGIAKTRG